MIPSIFFITCERFADLTAYRAFKNLRRFQPNTNFKAWLSTILRNTFINEYRRRKRNNIHEKPVEEILHKVDQGKYTQNEGVINLEYDKLSGLIYSLKPIYHVPFVMFFKGYSYEEISSQLDIPIGTVKSRIFTARRKLKSSINNIYTIAN